MRARVCVCVRVCVCSSIFKEGGEGAAESWFINSAAAASALAPPTANPLRLSLPVFFFPCLPISLAPYYLYLPLVLSSPCLLSLSPLSSHLHVIPPQLPLQLPTVLMKCVRTLAQPLTVVVELFDLEQRE